MHVSTWWLLAAAALASGCGPGGGQKGICPDPAEGGPVALFDLFLETGEELAPFPSDLKTVPDPSSPTGIRLSYERTMFREGLNVLSGAGLRSVMLVPYARRIDAGSLSPGSSVFLLDIEGLGEAEAGTLESRMIPVEVGMAEDGNSLFMPTVQNAIAVRPVDRLDPTHRYSLVVTSCVTAPDGSGLGAQDRFADLRDGGEPPTGASPSAVLDLRGVVDYLSREGYDRGDLAMVTTLTTQDPEHDLLAAREVLSALAPPDPAITDVFDAADTSGSINPDLLDHLEDPAIDGDPADLLSGFDLAAYRFDRIDKVVFGTFDAPHLLDSSDMIAREEDSWTPRVTGTETLEFLLTIPREDTGSSIGPPYRILVYQHAMTVCKETILALADTMARFGIAVVGIDTIRHGSRHPEEPGTCSLEFGTFMYIDNFSRSAAYFLQTVADIWSLVRMIREGTPIDVAPADGDPDLDATLLAFAGQSMGSSIGIDAIALEPGFGAGVVNVGGADLMNLILALGMDLPDDPVPDLADYSLYDMTVGAVVPPMGDGVDPATWTGRLLLDPAVPFRTAPISILYQQAAYDEIVPYEMYETTALLMGIPGVDPSPRPIPGLATVETPVSGNIDDATTAALFQFDRPAEHQFLLMCDDPALMFAAQLQLAVFVDTYLGGSTPVVIDPFDDAEVATYAPRWTWP